MAWLPEITGIILRTCDCYITWQRGSKVTDGVKVVQQLILGLSGLPNVITKAP
jgi:hypothetical protein